MSRVIDCEGRLTPLDIIMIPTYSDMNGKVFLGVWAVSETVIMGMLATSVTMVTRVAHLIRHSSLYLGLFMT
jgi:hypothetical protein